MPAPAGVTFLGPLAAARNGDGRLEIFALAQDPIGPGVPGDIYHASQLEATNGPAELVQVGELPLRGGGKEPLLAPASGDLWSDLATPLWTSLGRPPHGGVMLNDPSLQGQGGGLVLPQTVLAPALDALGNLMLCVVGGDGNLYSRAQSAPSDSRSWDPWRSSPAPPVAVAANLTVVTSGNAVFAFLTGALGRTNQVIYFVQNGSGQPWSGPFGLGSPVSAEFITALTATVDAAGGIMLVVTVDAVPPVVPNAANLFSNHLPPGLNEAWGGWTALPATPGAQPAFLMNAAWARGALYLIFCEFEVGSLFYVRYGAPVTRFPSLQFPSWAPAVATLATVPTGLGSGAADSWDGPASGTAEILGTAAFYVDQQLNLWMASLTLSPPIGLEPPQLMPQPPVQIDTGAWSAGDPSPLLPQQAVIRNASGLWQVFYLETGQCYRWTESPPA